MNQSQVALAGAARRLKTCGVVGPIEVRRGMTVLDQTGEPVGLVAGVVVAAGSDTVSEVVVSHMPPTGNYWLAPAELVTSVGEDRLTVIIVAAVLESLPRHMPE